ncbi:MAG TPA: TolC family protein [Armatimonadota bacterium]
MTFTRVVLWVAIGLLLCCGTVGAETAGAVRQPVFIPAERVLTLADCLALARQNQPTIRQAQAQIMAESGAVTQARAGLLPGLSASSSTQVAGGGGNGHTQYVFSGSQLVYNFGRTPELVRQAKELRAAGVQNLTGASADVVLNVKQAYYTLLQDQHLVDVFTKNLAQQQAHVAQTEAQEAAGVAPHTAVLTAQVAAASAQVDLITAQNTANLARVNLNTAMGVDIRSPLHIAEATEPDIPVLTEEQAVKLALAQRPEVRRDTAQLLAAEANHKAARTGNLPALVASANYTPNPGATAVGQQRSWALLLGVQWNFFDAGATSGAVETARAQVTVAEETLYTDKQTITSEVVQARLTIIAALAQLASAQVEVTSAQANLDAAVGSYTAGIGIFLNVIDAQAALLKAQVDVFSARYGLSIARAQFEHAVGGTP